MKMLSRFVLAALILFVAGISRAQDKPAGYESGSSAPSLKEIYEKYYAKDIPSDKQEQQKLKDKSGSVSTFKEVFEKYRQDMQVKQNSPDGQNIKNKKTGTEIKEAAFPTIYDIITAENKAKYSQGVQKQVKKNTVSSINENVIYFPDENLRNAICQALYCTPEELTETKLLELQYLSIFFLNVSDITGIEYCQNLRDLTLWGNNISNFTILSSLVNLESLNISNNSVPMDDLSFLNTLTNLSTLYLMNMNLTDISFLTQFPNLKNVGIADNPIADFTPITSLVNLESFYAVRTNLQNLNILAGATNLTKIDVGFNQITDISILSNFPNLTMLSIPDNPISDLSPIQNLDKLWYLDLGYLNIGSNTYILNNKPALTNLFLQSAQITNIDFLNNLPGLKYLSLYSNPIISFDALSNLTDLQMLDVSYTGISDLNLLSGAANISDLFIYNNNITDITPLFSFSNLFQVGLSGNPLSNKTILVDIPQLINSGVNVYHSDPRNLVIIEPTPESEIIPGNTIVIKWKNEDCQWNCAGGAIWVNIDLSTDGGNSWTNVAENTENDGVYEWLIPSVQSNNCIIKISDAEVPADIFTLSSVPFSIPQQQVVVQFPDAALEAKIREALGGYQGSLTPPKLREVIQLLAGNSGISNLSGLEYCTNLSWAELIGNQVADISVLTGLPKLIGLDLSFNQITDISPLFSIPNLNFVWLFSNPLSNKTLLIDIPLLANKVPNISYSSPRGLIALEPNEGSEIIIGNTFIIKWKNEDPEPWLGGGAVWVNIDLSTDGGNSWVNITQNTPNDGEYEWLVPSVQSNNCIIKISDAEVPDVIYTLSSVPFSIPQQQVVVRFPDAALEAKIREALGGYQGDLTAAKLKEVETVWACCSGITNLSGIEYCTNLQWLDVPANQITDITPVTQLPNLFALSVSNNPVENVSLVSSLPNLRILFLDGTNTQDISFLNDMPDLIELGLSNNPVSDFSPLYNLTNLNRLEITAIGVSDISFVSGMNNLNILGAAFNNITDISVLQNLTSLQRLGLSLNPVSDITVISSLTNLVNLEINNTGASDLTFLQNLSNLKELFVFGNNITDISVLGQITGLELLGLSDNQISDFTPLLNLPNLWRLDLQNTGISDISFIESFQNLFFVDLGENDITNISPLFNLPALNQVNLGNNPLSNKVILTDIPALKSKGIFVRHPEVRQLITTAPVDTSNIIAGNTFNIQWKNSDCANPWNCGGGAANVNVDLSIDGGSTWMNIIQNTVNDSLYEWLVPDVESENCLIRVSDSDVPDIFDVTDNPFIIKAPPAALDNIVNLLAEMNAFNSFPNNKARKDLEKVVKSVEKSLKSELWEDENHLDAKRGDNVFSEHKDAVKDLEKIIKDYTGDLAVSSAVWLTILKDADHLLVTTLFADTYSALDSMGCEENPEDKDCEKAYKELDKAQKDYDKALEKIAEADYPKAIDYFEKTWKGLQDALDKLIRKNAPSDLTLLGVPESFELNQNYPNPFNPSTVIRFGLPSNSMVTIKVYNMLGEEATTLISGFMEAGYHETAFNAGGFASGLFIYRIEAVSETGERFIKSQKMMLMK